MWFKTIFILFPLLFILPVAISAQENESQKDTISLYENIETFSEKRRITTLIHKMIFKPVDATPSRIKKASVQSYKQFEGKTIRHIHIETLDPFGYSLSDTTTQEGNLLTRTGNTLHVKTRATTIRNLLLFREGQPFNTTQVRESERLVRSREYITDVLFRVREDELNPDLVDITIRVLDKWSTIPGGDLSGTKVTINLKESNFAGLGHTFHNDYMWNHSTGDRAYLTRYHIPNIRNTFINSTIYYRDDEFGNINKYFSIDRPFYSRLARWAGGVSFSQHMKGESLWAGNIAEFKYNEQDYWAGYSIPFMGEKSYLQATNLITSIRYIRTNFLRTPSPSLDTLLYYSNQNFLLASLGVSTRDYVQDKFIFKYGMIEDVPVGKVVSITAGYQQKNLINRVYLGGRISSGDFYNWGYLGADVEYGTFFNDSKTEHTVISAGINYFTGLLEIGNWRLRQFVKPQVTLGFDLTNYDSLTINNEMGIHGFYSHILSGTSRVVLTTQTQLYAPWNLLGFHFGPYFVMSFGMLGDNPHSFPKGRVYSKFGVGVLIKNYNLVMNSFQLSLSFYPIIPGRGNDVFRFNSYQTSDYGFRDFETGKPSPVIFR